MWHDAAEEENLHWITLFYETRSAYEFGGACRPFCSSPHMIYVKAQIVSELWLHVCIYPELRVHIDRYMERLEPGFDKT